MLFFCYDWDMNIKNIFTKSPLNLTFTLFLALAIACPTLVLAADVEEVSYDDLVNQLNRKKQSYKQSAAHDPFDTLKIHAGLGLITSANQVSTTKGSSTRYQNGFQLSVGIDLFSPEWAAEAALRNFGQASTGSETRSLREFDLKMMNRGSLSSAVGYRLGAGLGTRYLKIEDGAQNISVNDSTATAIIFGGFEAFASKNMSLGIETGFRTALMNDTADKGSLDMMIRLDTYF